MLALAEATVLLLLLLLLAPFSEVPAALELTPGLLSLPLLLLLLLLLLLGSSSMLLLLLLPERLPLLLPFLTVLGALGFFLLLPFLPEGESSSAQTSSCRATME
jgi:hypothetical protein